MLTAGEWLAFAGVMATCMSVVVTIIIFLHRIRKEEMLRMERRLQGALDSQSKASEAAHLMLTTQVRDIADGVRETYVDRREFDGTIRMVRESMTQISKDVGHVGNRVDECAKQLSNRIDQLFHRHGD